MTNRERFIFEVEQTIKDVPDFFSEEALAYFEELKNGKASMGGLTDNGRKVLEWLNEPERRNNYFSAKLIGEGLFVSSRVVSGAARKLITDGYLEKEGKNPVTYKITNAGKEILLRSEFN